MALGLGASPHVPFYVRNMSRQSTSMPKGLIASPVAGRTDRINVNAKPNSYVIPADVVSGIGQGNTLAGGRIFDAMLKQGPYGSAAAGAMRGGRGNVPKAPKPGRFAEGGLADGAEAADEDVPIIVAGGEYHVEPEIVAALGGGDPAKGHKILDQMVLTIRKQVIKELKSLPGPKR